MTVVPLRPVDPDQVARRVMLLHRIGAAADRSGRPESWELVDTSEIELLAGLCLAELEARARAHAA
jgi:hypothetical protein